VSSDSFSGTAELIHCKENNKLFREKNDMLLYLAVYFKGIAQLRKIKSELLFSVSSVREEYFLVKVDFVPKTTFSNYLLQS